MFAMEYNNIEPNNTFNLPFLSPNIPKKIPPTNMPIICMLISNSPWVNKSDSDKPIDAKLGLRIMENNNKSYTSTKNPSALTITLNENNGDDKNPDMAVDELDSLDSMPGFNF